MTPGGIDLVLEGSSSADDWIVLLYEIRSHWPDAIFQKIDEHEMFAYRDHVAFRAGLREETTGADPFVHVLVGADSVTLVVDPPFAEMGRQVLKGLASSRG